MPKDEKLHILFLSSWYPNQEAPLDGNFVLKHAEAVAHFARVSFLHVSSLPLTNKAELDLQATIHFYESQVLPRKGLRKIFLVLQKLWRYSQLYRQVCREQGKPDVIHANVAYPSGLYALFFKLFTRSPYLITEHWTGYLPEKNTPLRPFQKTMTKWVLRKASFICPVSGYLLFSNYETFRVVIAEAFAAGIPVISTASGPAKELIAPERGILIPIGDEKALVKAIKAFPSQKTRFQADKIQTYAREHFSFRAVGQQYMDLYSQMLKPIPCSKK